MAFAGEEKGKVWGTKVAYLNEEQRAQYKLTVHNGLLYDSGGNLFDTKDALTSFGTSSKRAIFVMDKYGNIYGSNNPVTGKFNHASFLAGGHVAAAGEIEAPDGKLTLITPKSDHYRPKSKHIAQFVSHLEMQGINVSTDMVDSNVK